MYQFIDDEHRVDLAEAFLNALATVGELSGAVLQVAIVQYFSHYGDVCRFNQEEHVTIGELIYRNHADERDDEQNPAQYLNSIADQKGDAPDDSEIDERHQPENQGRAEAHQQNR